MKILSHLTQTLFTLSTISLIACSESSDTPISSEDETQNTDTTAVIDNPNEDYSLATHGKDAEANYDLVFPRKQVNRIDIILEASQWQTMLEDMTELYGEFGGSGSGTGPGNGPGGQGPGGGNFAEEDPVWVEGSVRFNDLQWDHVGVRFKGNSTLSGAWQSGNYKIPFKLDFDQWEDTYPSTLDQRFYGFKQLALGSNYKDNSFLREKLMADLFREAGVSAPMSSYVELYVDFGEGAQYFGLYTMVEVPAQDFLDTQFGNSSGNLYKPDGEHSHFESDNIINDTSFPKKTNEDEADWSDIERLQSLLNAETRLSSSQEWRDSLGTILDVDSYIRWLAANTAMTNWDTYGVMDHNFYLYGDMDQEGRLVWIPWDNNESLTDQARSPINLDLSGVSDEWPMISYMRDDDVYYAQYWQEVKTLVEEVFVSTRVNTTIDEEAALIQSSVEKEESGYTYLSSPQEFTTAISDLKSFVSSREASIQAQLP